MTDQELLDRGFKQFNPTPFDSDGIETCFQKRYDDDVGKRYFITVHKWKPMTHPHTHEVFPASYEYNVQLSGKANHDAVDVLFHSTWELDAVEDCLRKMFETGMFDYYEKFND